MLRSRDNPRVKHWSKLARDPRYRRAQKRALVEGPHLVAALLEHGMQPVSLLATESGIASREIASLIERSKLSPVLLSESIFKAVTDAENLLGLAAEIAIPDRKSGTGTRVFLEGIQDAGNVGAIIRSAAAFGIAEVVLDKGCADPWSPKALRAGMGGHFGLGIGHGRDLLANFDGKLVCTVARGGIDLRQADLSGPIGWLFGSEGRGISPRLLEKADLRVTIPTAPGTESLNVAAAAAICLYHGFFNRPGGRS